MEALRERFLRHAGKSVLLGRFVAVLRVLAGPIAGAVHMPYRRFLLFNMLGAVLWASTMVGLAWLGGRWIPFDQMLKGVAEFGLGALVLLAIVLVVPKLVGRFEERALETGGEEPPA
jgi:membrane protein DedA with SNARE-associated domain